MSRKYRREHWLRFFECHRRAGHESLQKSSIAIIITVLVQIIGHGGRSGTLFRANSLCSNSLCSLSGKENEIFYLRRSAVRIVSFVGVFINLRATRQTRSVPNSLITPPAPAARG
jgi:hypothetical protein